MPNVRVLFSADERMPGAEPRVTAAADTAASRRGAASHERQHHLHRRHLQLPDGEQRRVFNRRRHDHQLHVSNGGTEAVYGTASNTIVKSGGVETVIATASFTSVSGGGVEAVDGTPSAPR